MPLDFNELKDILDQRLSRIETKLDSMVEKHSETHTRLTLIDSKVERHENELREIKQKSTKMNNKIIYYNGALAAIIFILTFFKASLSKIF